MVRQRLRVSVFAAGIGLLLALLPIVSHADEVAVNPKWVGSGACRLLVQVAPLDLGKRPSDEIPARIRIEAAKLPLHVTRVDVDSIQDIGDRRATADGEVRLRKE